MTFDQGSFADRCIAAATCYELHGGQVSPYGYLAPASEARVRRLETKLRRPLPADLRDLLLQSEGAHFEWSLPTEATAALGDLAPVTSGKLHWDLGDLWECEQLRRAWVKADFGDPSNPAHRFWQDSVPVQYFGDGKFLALYAGSLSGEAVIYLRPRLDGLHGVELAPTYGDFLDRLTRLGCPGPAQAHLSPFVSRDQGIEVQGPVAQRWCEFLQFQYPGAPT